MPCKKLDKFIIIFCFDTLFMQYYIRYGCSYYATSIATFISCFRQGWKKTRLGFKEIFKRFSGFLKVFKGFKGFFNF